MPEESAEVDKVHGADKLLGGRFVFPEVYGDDLAGNRMDGRYGCFQFFRKSPSRYIRTEKTDVLSFGKNIIVGVPSLNSSWAVVKTESNDTQSPVYLSVFGAGATAFPADMDSKKD